MAQNGTIPQISLRGAALISGWGLLAMTLFALYPFNFIFPDLISYEEASTTVKNIMANERELRLGICCLLIVIILDVLVAWSLYLFLRPTHRSLSLLASWFRLVYASIFAVALSNYFAVLQLLNDESHMNFLADGQTRAKVLLALKAFDDTWAIGLIFFGFHLVILGYLTFKSTYVPKFYGLLLGLAGMSYLVDYFSRFLNPEAHLPISTYLGWGEPVFMIWLLIAWSARKAKFRKR